MIENQSKVAYKGVEFNNRLEAIWAAFFDLVDWRWHYRPALIGLWQPTFCIDAKGSPDGYVPVAVQDTPWLDLEYADFIKLQDKRHELLYLGCGVSQCQEFSGPRLGWIRDVSYIAEEGVNSFEECAFGCLGGIGFHGGYGSWRNRITGEYDGDQCTFTAPVDVHKVWKQAAQIIGAQA